MNQTLHLPFSDIYHETFQLYQLQNSLDCVTSVTKTAEHYCKYDGKKQILFLPNLCINCIIIRFTSILIFIPVVPNNAHH